MFAATSNNGGKDPVATHGSGGNGPTSRPPSPGPPPWFVPPHAIRRTGVKAIPHTRRKRVIASIVL